MVRGHLLSPRTAIPPDIPVGVQSLLSPTFPDLGRGDALVLAIVPLPNILGDFHLGVASCPLAERLAMGFPGQLVFVDDVEQLQGALGAAPRRDIAGGRKKGTVCQLAMYYRTGTDF